MTHTPIIDISKAKPVTAAQIERRLGEIKSEQAAQKRFICKKDGVYLLSEDNPPFFICSPLTVVALTRDKHHENWGQLISFQDHDGKTHELIIPQCLYKSDGIELRGLLLERGLFIASKHKARKLLSEYLQAQQPTERAYVIDHTGWYDDKIFLLPDKIIGGELTEKIIYPSHYSEDKQLHQQPLD